LKVLAGFVDFDFRDFRFIRGGDTDGRACSQDRQEQENKRFPDRARFHVYSIKVSGSPDEAAPHRLQPQ